ncbi:hypothetical protein [Fodinibius sediminis]|uniref:Uncharacterized protein n=1 Tax=Fodinibius sediminis TaxID=1214077 RepID=A0A521CBP1_9BACT|nr:hypothetical protein [Fodinibius sediminis]SMO56852.1 hypothetical protein SAMN06265218_105239 [Fodinibius sediminis]
MSIKKLFRAFKLWHYKKANGVGSYLHDQYLTVLHFIYETERVKLIKAKKENLKSEDYNISLPELLFRSTILFLLVWIGAQHEDIYQYLKWVIYPILGGLLSIPLYFLFEYIFDNKKPITDNQLIFQRIVFIKLFITGSFYSPPNKENKEPLYIKFSLYIAMVFVTITMLFLSLLTNKDLKVLLYKFATLGLQNNDNQVLFEFTNSKKYDLEKIETRLKKFALNELGYTKKGKTKKKPYLKKEDYPKAKAIAENIAVNPEVRTYTEFWVRLKEAINKSKEINNKTIGSEDTLRQYDPFNNYIKDVLNKVKPKKD